MNGKITSATVRAIDFNADAATATFYAALRERRLRSTRCRGCGHVPYPPRLHCPRCASRDVEWIDLPTRGTLHAFTHQQRGWRFSKPDVIGLVALPGVTGLVLSNIAAPIATLAIGIDVEVDFVEVGPDLVLHQFRPTKEMT